MIHPMQIVATKPMPMYKRFDSQSNGQSSLDESQFVLWSLKVERAFIPELPAPLPLPFRPWR